MEPVAENVKLAEVELEVLKFWDEKRFLPKRWRRPVTAPSFSTTVPHLPLDYPTTVICWLGRSKILFHGSGPCADGTSNGALGGTATVCRWKWKSNKRWDSMAKADIERFGVAQFNTECRKIVLRYTQGMGKNCASHGALGRFSQ